MQNNRHVQPALSGRVDLRKHHREDQLGRKAAPERTRAGRVSGHIKIDDILLLFIYLELGAMVGIYFKTNHMPVRFLIYVAITALTRLLISNVSHHNPPDVGIIYLCGGILLLAFAILVVRYASSAFPSVKVEGPRRKGEASLETEKGEL